MLLAIGGQTFLKKGVDSLELSLNINSIIKTLMSPWVFTGFLFYGLSSILWLFTLKRFPLSVAYPALSLTYVAIVIVSAYFFKEPITGSKIAGILFILGGVFLLFR